MEKDLSCSVTKTGEVAILISRQIDFKTKILLRDKEWYSIIIIEGSIST